MRRVWIEIIPIKSRTLALLSPSMRRVWIEILVGTLLSVGCAMSPSMRRVWIEMDNFKPRNRFQPVTLHAEGVD